MTIETMITSIMVGILIILGPATQTIKIYKKNLSTNSYAITQRIMLVFQFLFAALTIASLSYQLVVKNKTHYESNVYVDLVTYMIAILFTIFNLIYFKYFIIDYELKTLT